MTALCHADRPHAARGLCRACYQRWKIRPSDDLAQIVSRYAVIKSQRITANGHKHKLASKENRRGERYRFISLRRRYGLSREKYEEMLTAQGGTCAICSEPPPPGRHLYVDHCHQTEMNRKLLCPRCNTFVGYVEGRPDLIEKIMRYIDRA